MCVSERCYKSRVFGLLIKSAQTFYSLVWSKETAVPWVFGFVFFLVLLQ